MATDTKILVSQAIDMIAFWKVDEKTWRIKKVKLNEAMEEFGLSKVQFHYHINKNEQLKTKYEEVKDIRRNMMKDKAEDNLADAMEGEWKFATMEAKDTARLSLDILKQTEDKYNPKAEIELNTKNLNFDIPLEEMEKMVMELLQDK